MLIEVVTYLPTPGLLEELFNHTLQVAPDCGPEAARATVIEYVSTLDTQHGAPVYVGPAAVVNENALASFPNRLEFRCPDGAILIAGYKDPAW